ncbi:ribosomal-protein-alanine N-acetyltransferase [Egibacter rhizosphaerae]|uniref:Ribosomal-protein-alanine N-acetyltransferase n=1 Tax=Egibacter rhizosphaerae TaxID=1670831 RepID=A0A411YH71_9ACTN|nr:ribosomal protein S18-alanine N-acetyltransferase [Egibacter rhizosphaerae]QBI20583.1 ribosomal-protein-alanine N-acetyltransferase [Egibacter rhizosphaerae]
MREGGRLTGWPTRRPAARTALHGVRIEPMRRRHLRRVLAIETRLYPRPWTPEVFVGELARDGRSYLVARVPGRLGRRRVVGYGGVLFQAGEAHVTTVAVDPVEHRRKVATRLVIALLEEARERGSHAATLEVRAANHGAQRLYSAFGFVPKGVRPRYYRETDEDAVVMWIDDLRDPAVGRRLEAQRARLEAPGGASGAPDHDVPWVTGRVGLHAGTSGGDAAGGDTAGGDAAGHEAGGGEAGGGDSEGGSTNAATGILSERDRARAPGRQAPGTRGTEERGRD